ncbi:MAG: CBS domain-containing protein [Cyclobacteriaceae bacterium]
MKLIPVSKVMTEQVRSIAVNEPLIEVRNLMDEWNINHLPVKDGEKLVGLISRTDIQQVSYICDYLGEKLEDSIIFKTLSIDEVMTKNITFLSSKDSIMEAVKIFSQVSFHCLPIIDNGELVGIVSSKDIFRYLLKTSS